jgi:hypothetical protein
MRLGLVAVVLELELGGCGLVEAEAETVEVNVGKWCLCCKWSS